MHICPRHRLHVPVLNFCLCNDFRALSGSTICGRCLGIPGHWAAIGSSEAAPARCRPRAASMPWRPWQALLVICAFRCAHAQGNAQRLYLDQGEEMLAQQKGRKDEEIFSKSQSLERMIFKLEGAWMFLRHDSASKVTAICFIVSPSSTPATSLHQQHSNTLQHCNYSNHL